MKQRLRLSILLSLFALTINAQRGWKLIWSDEFDTDGLPDPAVWEPERGFVRNHEAQWYQGENARQEGGSLIIEARPDKDSLAPVVDFVRNDIEHFMESFEWR